MVCEEHCFHNLNNPTTACVPNLHTKKKHVEICKFVTQSVRSVEHVINDGLIVQQLVRKTIQDQKAQQDLQDEKHAVSKDNSESFLKE